MSAESSGTLIVMFSLRRFVDLRGATGKLLVGLAVTLAVLAALTLVAPGLSWTLRGLAAWCGGVGTYLALAWRLMLWADADRTRRHCRREDESRGAIDMLLLAASAASVAAVALALRDADAARGASRAVAVGIPILAVVLSWLLTHTLYALHYARLFYVNNDDPDGPPVGGFDFHNDGDAMPDYWDFVYVALAVACTFGLTDTEATNNAVRRTITKHALLAFVFATVVFALALNVISTLLSGNS